MNESKWHREPPPLEAYSRVTNPERFLPLHALALVLVDQLTADYDVERTEASKAAPIAIAFTAFPSLVVRCGRWVSDSFPSCGCDACDEIVGSEGERLDRLLAEVVAGRFREVAALPSNTR